MVVNQPSYKAITMFNKAVIDRYDEEDHDPTDKFNLADEAKKISGTKFLNKLKLDNNTKAEVEQKHVIKINTAVKYIPCIYTDQNTVFRVNFGASPFRNHQPEFAPGLLYYFDEKRDGKVFKEPAEPAKLESQGTSMRNREKFE